jgi:hypothetical protein
VLEVAPPRVGNTFMCRCDQDAGTRTRALARMIVINNKNYPSPKGHLKGGGSGFFADHTRTRHDRCRPTQPVYDEQARRLEGRRYAEGRLLKPLRAAQPEAPIASNRDPSAPGLLATDARLGT